jgi:prophage regulatory protein
MPTATSTPETRVLSLKTVLARVPLSRTTLWRLEREGLFPQRIKLSENRVGWLEEDIEQWIQRKKEA